MLTNREKQTLIENVLYSLDEAGIARGLGRLGKAGLGKIGKGIGKAKDAAYKAWMSPTGGKVTAGAAGAGSLAAAAALGANMLSGNDTSSKKAGMNFGKYAPGLGVAGLGALVGGIVGATSKNVRIAKLKKALAKCGKDAECVENLEATLNRLDNSINWSALIGAAIGGGLAAGGYNYGGAAYDKVASKFKKTNNTIDMGEALGRRYGLPK